MPQFHCPHCGQHIDAGDEYAGMAATCPACNSEITVPVAGTESVLAAHEYPAEAEPEQFYAEANAEAEAETGEPDYVPPPPSVPAYQSPTQASFYGFAADHARKQPRPGFAHYMLAIMAIVVAAGVGWSIGYMMAQPEAGVKVEESKQMFVANTFMIGFGVCIILISLVLSTITALIFLWRKKPFWRNFLTAFGIFTLLVSGGYGALFWTARDAPGLKIFYKPTEQPKKE